MRLFNDINAWELGGYQGDGGIIKPNLLLRSCKLSRFNAKQLRDLADVYHTGEIIDLRTSWERIQEKDPEVPGAVYYPVSIIDEDNELAQVDFAAILERYHGDRVKMMVDVAKSGKLDESMYVQFLSGETGKKGYAEFFRILLATPEDQAVLWHCTDGKDRTGLAAMLLLSALGVDEQTILKDYLLTNQYNGKKLAFVASQLDQELSEVVKKRAMTLLGGVNETLMINALDYLKQTYGSVMGYIKEVLHVQEEEIILLKARYLM